VEDLTADTKKVIRKEDPTFIPHQVNERTGRPEVDGLMTTFDELKKAGSREEIWPYQSYQFSRTDFCTVPRCHKFMDGAIQYLDEEAEESWEQVCKYHGAQKKWRTYKIQ